MDLTRRNFLGNMGKALVGLAVASVIPYEAEAKVGEIYIPKIGTINLNRQIIYGGNFTWGEATKNGERIPQDTEIIQRIINSAEYMQKIRGLFEDRPITVTSWYRDPKSNAKVSKSHDSRHLYGDAVDFKVAGISPEEVYRKLEKYHGNRGGLAKSVRDGFTHVDLRGRAARWDY